MSDFLPGAVLLLLVGGVLFAWVDWRLRLRKLPARVFPSWDCPHCTIVNEADRHVCWACGAAIGHRAFAPGLPPSDDTWQCRRCRSWNGRSRRSCWSCHTAPSPAPKRDA